MMQLSVDSEPIQPLVRGVFFLLSGLLVSCGGSSDSDDESRRVSRAAPAEPAPLNRAPSPSGHGLARKREHTHTASPAPSGPPQHGDAHRPFEDTKKYIAHLESPDRAGWQKPNAVVVALDLAGDETVVDMGAGSGFFTFPFAKALPLGKVLALDTDPEMVRHIQKRAKDQGVHNVEARRITPDAPKIDPNTRLLFLCNVLHHVPARKQWLRGLFEQLPKGARFTLIEFKMGEIPVGPPEKMRIPRKELVNLVTGAGFVLDREHKDVLPYQLFLIFRKP